MQAVRRRLCSAGSVHGFICWLWYMKRGLFLVCAGAIALLVLLACPAGSAMAGIIPDVNDLFEDMSGTMLSSAYDFLQGTTQIGPLDKSFNDLLGSVTAYKVVQGAQSVFIGVGQAIVAFCAMVQMASIGSRLDSAGAAVEVREVFFLMIYCAVFFYLVNNSFAICDGVYELIRNLMEQVHGNTSFKLTSIMKEKDFTDGFTSALSGASLVAVSAFTLIGTAIAQIVIFFVTTARYLQIYLYTAVAPVPLALLANDETKQWGLGFIKNYLAVCLAGVIMLLCAILYMPMLAGAGSMPVVSGLSIIGIMLVYLFALIKSGSWARDILGG